MFEELDWNWDEAFNAVTITPVVGESVSTDRFGREDIKRIIAFDDGVHDEINWVGVFQLNDNRFVSVEAGCDYTGWDCACWGRAEVSSSLNDVIRFGLDDNSRERLGLVLEEDRLV